MRVSIILNETDITFIIIIVMVMIMMEEVAKPVILFTNPLIRITKLKLVKKKIINKNVLRLGSSKTKK